VSPKILIYCTIFAEFVAHFSDWVYKSKGDTYFWYNSIKGKRKTLKLLEKWNSSWNESAFFLQQRLLGWVKDKLPDLPVNNFTTDWNSGKAVGALVDSVAPGLQHFLFVQNSFIIKNSAWKGLCPDWEDWDPKKPLQNAREAMDLADEWLNVPKLLTPEEIVNPKLDEQSMMTYLSQFPNAKLKPGAPLRQRTNPSKVRAYGPGKKHLFEPGLLGLWDFLERGFPKCGLPYNFLPNSSW